MLTLVHVGIKDCQSKNNPQRESTENGLPKSRDLYCRKNNAKGKNRFNLNEWTSFAQISRTQKRTGNVLTTITDNKSLELENNFIDCVHFKKETR